MRTLTNIAIALIVWMCGHSLVFAQTDTLHFSFQAGVGKRGVTYAYPLMLNDSLTAADSLYAGEMTFSDGESVYDIVGIQTTGTLLSSASNVQFNPVTGILSFAHTQPITGKGIFVDFLIAIKPNAYGSDQTTVQSILLNEGNILGLITNGSMRPMDIFISPKNPPKDRIVGDTIQFTATGDVHLPVTWTVGDTHIVSIDGTGRVIGKNVGQTTVSVVDDVGLTDQSLLLPIHPPTLRSLTVTVPDMSVMQNLTVLLPINVSSVTGLGITSAQFRLSYNTSQLVPLGVITSGALSAGWTEPTVLYGSNYLDVAMAGAVPLSDSGTFVFVQFKVKRYANFSAAVNLSNVLFNENLNATVKNGIFTALPGPVITLSGKPSDMIPGESKPLSVSGGTSPHRWKMLSDTSIASIDSISGLLKAKNRGMAVFSATDINGFDRADSVRVTDVRFTFPDTSFIYTDSIDYPILISSTDGLGIVAAQLTFQYDTARIQMVSVIRGGTVSHAMLMETKDSAGLRFALSSASPLNGAGQFFVLRFKSKGLSSIGHTQPMFFSQTLLNESGVSVRTASQRSGSLAVTNVPNYAPVFTAKLRDTTINENQVLQFQMKATDANNDSLIFGLFSSSSGMSLTNKGLFSWQPNFTQAGTHKVVYDVGDFRPDGVTRDSAVITVLNVNRMPQFTKIFGDTTISEGQVLSFDVDAVDPDGSPVRFDLVNAKAGMKIDSIAGLFTWTPSTNQSGIQDVVIRALDGTGGITVREIFITVTNVNHAPQFTKVLNDTTINENQPLTFDNDAIDPDGSPVRFDLVNARAGMMIDSITGIFAWTPNMQQSGVHDVVIRAKDPEGAMAVREVIITVTDANIPPVFIHAFSDTTIAEDQTLTYTLKATDADNDIVRYYIQNIQTGMVIDTNTGFISWRPTFIQSGQYNIAFIANDGKGGFANFPSIITVTNVNRPPFFVGTTPDSINIQPGQTVSVQFSGEDADNDQLIYTLTEGPQGSSLSSTGIFSWNPSASQAGRHVAMIALSDGIDTVRRSLIINVFSGNTPPAIVRALPDTTISEGQFFTFTYLAEDAEFDSLEWRMAGETPFGVKINPSGVLEWTPDFQQAGTYHIVVSVSDKQFSKLDSAVVTVLNTNRPPQFTKALHDTTIMADSLFTFTYSGVDPDQDSITFSFLKRPAGASITPAGAFQWKPVLVSRETLIVALFDGKISVVDTAIVTVTGSPNFQASAYDLDFGTTIFGTLPVKTVTIRNEGKIPLVLTRISGVPNGEHFTSDVTQQTTINPQQEITISITYTPQQIGSHSSAIAFQTNDPKRQYAGIFLRGTAISVAAVKRKLLVDLTHNSRIALKDSIDGMTQLFGALKKSGVEVAFAESAFAPAGYDALLLVSPEKTFTETEKGSLRQFVREGGLAVMMENATPEANNFVINDLLRDSLLSSGMFFQNTAVTDSFHNYFGNPFAPMITQFADTNHPFLNGVDSLVLFGSGMVITDSSAIPYATVTTPSIGFQGGGLSSSVIGMKKIGDGKIVMIGNTALWQNSPPENNQMPLNIAAKDNFTFALNLFSIDEDYAFKMPEKTPNEVYQLISIPLELKDVDILSVLKGSLGDINPLKWRLFGKFDPSTERYREFPSAGFSSFTRGEAYWLITRGEFSVNFGNAAVLPAQDFYPITIGPGYSMIGNPFPYPVSWKNSRIGDSVQTLIWRFDPSLNDFAPESLSMAPFAGYFVKNLSKDSVTIYINPQNVTLQKQGAGYSLAAKEWRVKIGATSGKASDRENTAGVSPGASAELDRFDISEPPTTPTDYLRVRFTNQHWSAHQGSYAADIRPVPTDGIYWDFDVSAAKGQSKVRLMLDQLGSFPQDFGLYLVDKMTERVTRFDRSATYEFTMGKSQSSHRFRLIAGKQEFVEKNTNGIPLIAVAHELRQNYPNPFNPSTYIYYTIGHSGNVQLEIFNVLGQRVRQLRNEAQVIGSYNIEWDGKDDAGEIVASGVYFYKVTVTSNNEKLFSQTKKMVLTK